MKKLIPLNEHVVLDITHDTEEQKTSSGIIIPATNKQKSEKTANVVSVSKYMGHYDDIKPGDKMLYNAYSGLKYSMGDKLYLVIHCSEMLAIISE